MAGAKQPEKMAQKCHAYLSIGGNVGDSKAILKSALHDIAALNHVELIKCSPFYESSPVSEIAQKNFINAVCCVNTSLDVRSFFSAIQEVEKKFGCHAKEKNAPRVLDIDLLFFGNTQLSTENLIVPHPRWRQRLFVLKPLADIAKDLNVPDGKGGMELLPLAELCQCLENNTKHTVKAIDNAQQETTP